MTRKPGKPGAVAAEESAQAMLLAPSPRLAAAAESKPRAAAAPVVRGLALKNVRSRRKARAASDAALH